MEPEKPLLAQGEPVGPPVEPFIYPRPDGSAGGKGVLDPQYIPGSVQYQVRASDKQFEAVNKRLFDLFHDSDYPEPSAIDFAAQGYTSAPIIRGAMTKQVRDHLEQIKASVPSGSSDEAAWYTLNVLQPRAEHDAQYLYGKVRPYVMSQLENSFSGGQFFSPADLSFDQIIQIARNNGADESVLQRVIQEENSATAHKNTGTYTFGKLRPMIDMIDPYARMGEMVKNDPETHLFSKTGLAKREAWMAYVNWMDRNGESFLGSAMTGIGHLLATAGYATAGLAEGAIGTILTIGSEGEVMLESGKTVLSDAWITRSIEERKEAQNVLARSHDIARRYGPEIAESMSDPALFASKMNERFGRWANQDEIATLNRLVELRKSGAYRPELSAEKLANFGEGVLNAVPSIVKMFNSSIDPNSVIFRNEFAAKSIIANDTDGMATAAFMDFIGKSEAYRNLKGSQIDRAISIFEENYREMTGYSRPIVSSLYKSLGMEDAAFKAEAMMQNEQMLEAGMFADPVLLIMGAGKLLGVGARAGATSAELAKARTMIRDATAEALELRTKAGTIPPAIKTAVAEIRAELENLFGKGVIGEDAYGNGMKLTDEDIISIALGDRKTDIGRSAAAQRIRKVVGESLARNKNLANTVNEANKILDGIPDATGAQRINQLRSRPVGGRVVTAAGAATEAVGKGTNWVADFLDQEYQAGVSGGFLKRMVYRPTKWLASTSGGRTAGGFVSGAAVGAYLLQGDVLGAVLSGVGGAVSTNTMAMIIRPDYLRSIGISLEQVGRMQKVIGANTTSGARYGESIFVKAAMDLEAEAAKIVELPGMKLSDAEKLKKRQLLDDARGFRTMHKMGIEDGMRNASRVVWEDGVISGGTGAFLAYLNDSDAAGAGAGMGVGFGLGIRSINRLYQGVTGNAALNQRDVISDVSTIVDGISDPYQKAKVLEYLGKAGNDRDAYIKRATAVRDTWIATRGNITFTSGIEFEMSTILTASPEAEAAQIAREAAAIHPNDPAKAEQYVKDRTAKIAEARNAAADISVHQANIDIQRGRLKQKLLAQRKAEQMILDAEKRMEELRLTEDGTDLQEGELLKLEKLKSAKSKIDAEIDVIYADVENIQADLNTAKGKAQNVMPMRLGETRLDTSGNSTRKLSNGFYIVDGPQGRKTYIDIDNIDDLGLLSEGWHALLSDSSVEKLMPEMVHMLVGDGSKYPVAVSNEVIKALIDAYTQDFDSATKSRFVSEFEVGMKAYRDSNGSDISRLVDPMREVMTWMMSSIDQNRRPGTRPGLAVAQNAPGLVSTVTPASRPGFVGTAGAITTDIVKTLFGDRQVSDNVQTVVRSLFDPVYGVFSRKYTSGIMSQLEVAGMRFVESGDGTLRGYFFNDKNEIVRSSVLNDFYDRVVSLTGGQGSSRIRPISIYDPNVPVTRRIEFIKANGMDWVLTPDGTGILPPEQVAQKVDQIVGDIKKALGSVPESQRGMRTYTNESFDVMRTGVPSQEEIAAIAGLEGIPPVIKNNLLRIMESLSKGESKSILNGEYSNIFSVGIDPYSEAQLRVGQDIEGKTERRNIAPLGIIFGEADVYDSRGKPIKVPDPSDPKKTVNLRQRTIKVHAFDSEAFTNSKNNAFQQGLFTIEMVNEKPSRVYVKDPAGRDYTASYLRELFGTDAEFDRYSTMWLNAYYAAGPIDPFSPTPSRDINPVSAEVLDPTNPERGAAMRDALRMIYTLDSGRKRLGWVQSNRETNSARGTVIRGTNFPLTDMRIEQFGELADSGQTFNIDQRHVTSGQFVMSPLRWIKTPIASVGGMRMSVIEWDSKNGKFANFGKDLTIPATYTGFIHEHPQIKGVKIYEFTDSKSRALTYFAYTMGDGKIMMLNGVQQPRSNARSKIKLGDAIDAVSSLIRRQEEQQFIAGLLGDLADENTRAAMGARVPSTIDVNSPSVKSQIKLANQKVSDLKAIVESADKLPPIIEGIKPIYRSVSRVTYNLENIDDLARSLRWGSGDPSDAPKTVSSLKKALEKQIADIDSAISVLGSTKVKGLQKARSGDLIKFYNKAKAQYSDALSMIRAFDKKAPSGISAGMFNSVYDLVSKAEINAKGGKLGGAVEHFAEIRVGNETHVVDLDYDPKQLLDVDEVKKAKKALAQKDPRKEYFSSEQVYLAVVEAEQRKAAGKPKPAKPGQAPVEAKAPEVVPVEPEVVPVDQPEVPELTAEEVAKIRSVRVTEKGQVNVIPQQEISSNASANRRYQEMLNWHDEQVRQQELLNKKLTKEEREREKQRKAQETTQKRYETERQRLEAMAEREYDRRQQFIEDERAAIAKAEQQAARKHQAAVDAANKAAQRLADKEMAIVNARKARLTAEIDAFRRKVELRDTERAKMVTDILDSNEPVIAPGVALAGPGVFGTAGIERTPLMISRGAATPSGPVLTAEPVVTERTVSRNILYLSNKYSFWGQLKDWNATQFQRYYGEAMNAKKDIMFQAFMGPMEAQQGINLINSRLWESQSGNRLFVEYKAADKAAGKDIRTYKVYGVNGNMVMTTNNAKDAVEAMENLERRFSVLSTYGAPAAEITENTPGRILRATEAYIQGAEAKPASQGRPGNVRRIEQEAAGIQNVERYLNIKPDQSR